MIVRAAFQFGEIRVQEQNPGNKYILTIAVDESFLTNSETVYPVTIDPTTSVTSTKRANLEYLCVYSNGTSYSSSSTSGADLRVGTFSNGRHWTGVGIGSTKFPQRI